MASPFTAEIIPLPLLGAKQEPGAPPRSAPVATRRYLRHMDADAIARLLDGTDYGEPEVVRRQREFAAIPAPFGDRLVDFFRRNGGLFVAAIIGAAFGGLATCGLAMIVEALS